MHKKHMFFYCGLTIVILIVIYNIVSKKVAVPSLALGVGTAVDAREPLPSNNKSPAYTPFIRRMLGVTAF